MIFRSEKTSDASSTFCAVKTLEISTVLIKP